MNKIVDEEAGITTISGQDLSGHKDVIILCDPHHQELSSALGDKAESHGAQAFHILARIATRAMGTAAVSNIHCPICALKTFDFVHEVAKVFQPRTN